MFNSYIDIFDLPFTLLFVPLSLPLDPPGTPVCIDVTRDSVTLQWDVPQRDGGSKIVAYSVERRHGRGKWLRCNFTDISETQFTVTGLSPGDRFEFRVIARNAVGTVSPPSNSSPYIMTKDESSKFIILRHSQKYFYKSCICDSNLFLFFL